MDREGYAKNNTFGSVLFKPGLVTQGKEWLHDSFYCHVVAIICEKLFYKDTMEQ